MNLYLAGGVSGNLQPDWKCVYTSQAHTPSNPISVNSYEGGGGGDDLPFLSGSYTRPYVLEGLAPRCNILESFYYIKPWQAELIPRFKSFMLDSGAFTMMVNGDTSTDLNSYVNRYIEFIKEYDVELFFELDIDSVVGYETVVEIRKRLERETKRKPIPVWHFSRGEEEFVRSCEHYDYVAFGGILTDGIPTKTVESVMPHFIDTAHSNNAKIHGLGYTSYEGLKRFHFDSVDSTAWLYGNRGGFLYRFNGRGLTKLNAPKGKKLDSKNAAIHNFREWVKFAEYCETHY